MAAEETLLIPKKRMQKPATKNLLGTFCALLAIILLCGFFWQKRTWQEIDTILNQQYPDVASIEIDTLKTALDQGQAPILIDVREKDEFAVSHLPNALHITTIEAVPYPKDTPIVVYCSVGVRSAIFSKKLAEAGFTAVKNLRGSIFAWANKGYTVRRGMLPVQAVHPFDKNWGTLLKKELHMYQLKSSEQNK